MILVTGATGLVGTHLLAKLLPLQKPIRALFRDEKKVAHSKKIIQKILGNSSSSFFEYVEWYKADITDIIRLTKAFDEVEYVYHCAGLISYSTRDYKRLRKINIEGTANVVNIALSKKIKKLCHVSSIATLGNEIGGKKITENSIRNNTAQHSNYSITKYGAEMEVWRATQEGLNAVIVNPGIIIGSGFWNSGSGLLFEKVAKGLRYHFPMVTGFVAVEDVVEAMILLMDSSEKNQHFIVVSENLSFAEVLQQIAKKLNKPAPQKQLQPWMVFVGWVFQTIGSWFGLKKEITRQSISGLFESNYFDASKIERIGFQFTPIEESLQKTAHAYQSENP